MKNSTLTPKRPLSPAMLAANRANAAHSTGPRTPEGKATSARNALRHGFATSSFGVVRLEDLQEIASLKADIFAVFQPANSQEAFALERMAVGQQTMRRAARLEAGLFTNCLNESLDIAGDVPFLPMNRTLAGDGDIEVTRAQNRNFLLAQGFHRLSQQSNSLSLFLRYQAQTERLYRRAVEEFDRIKALRGELPNEPVPDPEPEQNTDPYVKFEANPIGPPPPAPTPSPDPPAAHQPQAPLQPQAPPRPQPVPTPSSVSPPRSWPRRDGRRVSHRPQVSLPLPKPRRNGRRVSRRPRLRIPLPMPHRNGRQVPHRPRVSLPLPMPRRNGRQVPHRPQVSLPLPIPRRCERL